MSALRRRPLSRPSVPRAAHLPPSTGHGPPRLLPRVPAVATVLCLQSAPLGVRPDAMEGSLPLPGPCAGRPTVCSHRLPRARGVVCAPPPSLRLCTPSSSVFRSPLDGLVSLLGLGGSTRPACVLSAMSPAPGKACSPPAGTVASVVRLRIPGNWGTGGAESLCGGQPSPAAHLLFSGVNSAPRALGGAAAGGQMVSATVTPRGRWPGAPCPLSLSVPAPGCLSACSTWLMLWLCAQSSCHGH